jgi:REP element-mobilizing transposase RayT
MARPLRVDIEDGWYHITSRGIDRRQIFDGSADNKHFLDLLEKCADRYGIRIHAYCLMSNHYHLLMQTPHGNASKAMQWLNVSYGMWYNRRHGRVGPLFQGRFGSKLVDGQGSWVLELSIYMHLNPVRRAGLGLGKKDKRAEGFGWKKPSAEVVKARLQELRGYKWSSYSAYAGYRTPSQWLTTEELWKRSRIGKLSGKAGYRKLTEDRLRSDWKEDALDCIKSSVAVGSQEFIVKMKSLVKGDRKEQPELRKWQRLTPFPAVVEAVEQVRGETWEELSARRGDPAKAVALLLGRRHCGLSLRELGDAAGGMGYYAVSKAVTRVEARAKSDKKLQAMILQAERVLSNVQT